MIRIIVGDDVEHWKRGMMCIDERIYFSWKVILGEQEIWGLNVIIPSLLTADYMIALIALIFIENVFFFFYNF